MKEMEIVLLQLRKRTDPASICTWYVILSEEAAYASCIVQISI